MEFYQRPDYDVIVGADGWRELDVGQTSPTIWSAVSPAL